MERTPALVRLGPAWSSTPPVTRRAGSSWPTGRERDHGGCRRHRSRAVRHGGGAHLQRPGSRSAVPPLPSPPRPRRPRPSWWSTMLDAAGRPGGLPPGLPAGDAGALGPQRGTGRRVRPRPRAVPDHPVPARLGARRRHAARIPTASSGCGWWRPRTPSGRSSSRSASSSTARSGHGPRGAASWWPARSSRRSACPWPSCSGGPRTPSTSSGGSPRPATRCGWWATPTCTTTPSARAHGVPVWKYYYEARNMLYLHLHVKKRVGYYPRNITKLIGRAVLREPEGRLVRRACHGPGPLRRGPGPARHPVPDRVDAGAHRGLTGPSSELSPDQAPDHVDHPVLVLDGQGRAARQAQAVVEDAGAHRPAHHRRRRRTPAGGAAASRSAGPRCRRASRASRISSRSAPDPLGVDGDAGEPVVGLAVVGDRHEADAGQVGQRLPVARR